MAFVTLYLLMLSIEFEIGAVMVKDGYYPGLFFMAAKAIGNSVHFKLPVVIIRMAAAATYAQPRKTLFYLSI